MRLSRDGIRAPPSPQIHATYPGPLKLESQRYSMCSRLPHVIKWSALHPCQTTRNMDSVWEEEGGTWDSLFEHINNKGLSRGTWENPSNLNILYKSFHRPRNMSRFWSFPLISFLLDLALSTRTNVLTPHEVHLGGNYLFIGCQGEPGRWLRCPFSVRSRPRTLALRLSGLLSGLLCLNVSISGARMGPGSESTWERASSPPHRTHPSTPTPSLHLNAITTCHSLSPHGLPICSPAPKPSTTKGKHRIRISFH